MSADVGGRSARSRPRLAQSPGVAAGFRTGGARFRSLPPFICPLLPTGTGKSQGELLQREKARETSSLLEQASSGREERGPRAT